MSTAHICESCEALCSEAEIEAAREILGGLDEFYNSLCSVCARTIAERDRDESIAIALGAYDEIVSALNVARAHVHVVSASSDVTGPALSKLRRLLSDALDCADNLRLAESALYEREIAARRDRAREADLGDAYGVTLWGEP